MKRVDTMTIADVCRLSSEVRSGELLISVFLDQALVNSNSKEADRTFVLRATYPTAPLRSLLEHVAQKLSGKHPKGSAVVRGTYSSGKDTAHLRYRYAGGPAPGPTTAAPDTGSYPSWNAWCPC